MANIISSMHRDHHSTPGGSQHASLADIYALNRRADKCKRNVAGPDV